VKSVMSGAGSALMGIGSSRGDNRAVEAAEMAISSPLLEASIDGAHGVLLSISGGSDLGLFEINEAAQLVAEAAHAEANIIFGAVIDDALGDEVRVTVIAAGFDSGTPRRAVPTPARRTEPADGTGAASQPETRADATGTSFERSTGRGNGSPVGGSGDRVPEPALASHRTDRPAERPTESIEVGREPTPARSRTIVFDDNDDLDIPDFLK
jgi:cell division protein FtsZ